MEIHGYYVKLIRENDVKILLKEQSAGIFAYILGCRPHDDQLQHIIDQYFIYHDVRLQEKLVSDFNYLLKRRVH